MRLVVAFPRSLVLVLMLVAAVTHPCRCLAQEEPVAQEEPTAPSPHKLKRLSVSQGRSVTVRGFVGGEAHDSYIVHIESGRELSLNLRARGGNAEFTVSRDEFGEPVEFGVESGNGRRWTGKVPESADYFISVVAHPSANYALTVRVR